MEKKLYAIGEALIDFIPQESGRPMKDILGFCPKVGGARRMSAVHLPDLVVNLR